MENLLNYVRLRRDIDFSVRPFNEVDMLVCADLSYVDWDGIVEKDEVSLEEACRKYLSLYSEEELKSKYTFSKNLPHLIDVLQDTIRYGNIKLKNYKKVYSDEDVIQFSVVTLVLPDGSFVLSFSGTDGSITGWKENLMMTYRQDLPCQILAKDYVKETIADIPETSYLFGLKKKKVYPRMYLTGHSKGGNLAMYAYLKNPKLQGHIEGVKSFDGPGFADGFWQGDEDHKLYS